MGHLKPNTTVAKLVALSSALLLGAGTLTACSDPSSTKDESAESGSSAESSDQADSSFDFSVLEAQPEIVALVPDSIKEAGVLRNGASTDYAPAEFRTEDGQTPVGYEVDMIKAMSKVMGLEDGTTTHAEFPTIIPALGTKFDVGTSAFTITPERLENVNMVSYAQVGSSYAVAAGNPSKFDPTDPCGSTLGVQTGTYQYDYALELSEKCVADGKEPIDVMPHDLQTDVTTKVQGGQYDATFADSTVIGYAVKGSNGGLEEIGEVIESEPQGVTISKDDEQLTKAVQASLQYLMDNGYLEQIFANYGTQDAALSKAEINPSK